jgi:hypothetical protein
MSLLKRNLPFRLLLLPLLLNSSSNRLTTINLLPLRPRMITMVVTAKVRTKAKVRASSITALAVTDKDRGMDREVWDKVKVVISLMRGQ